MLWAVYTGQRSGLQTLAMPHAVNWPARTHETRTYEVAGFKRYYLSDNTSKRCSITLLDTVLLGGKMQMDKDYNNNGGWGETHHIEHLSE